MNNKTANKSFISVLIAFLMILSIIPVSVFNSLSTNATTNGFHVSGTKILDGNNQEFIMRGVNIAHAWYSSYTQASINSAAARGANVVRVVCSDGEQWTKTTQTELNKIINWCKTAEVICILEVHDTTGKNNTSYLDNAANYWVEMKSVLQGNDDYVIVNIGNEWYGSWNNASAWASGYKTAIATIRDAGIKNMLMIDAEGYGQWPTSIVQKGNEVFNSDTLKNTVFSIHMYQDAGKDERTVKNNIDSTLAIGVPIVIGEFAADHNGSDVDEATILSYCTEKKVGYIGWSWKGNSEGLESLDIALDWQGNTLSTWGDTLFNSTYGITNTSKLCSIYTGIIDSSSEEESSSVPDSSSQVIPSGSEYVVFDGSFNLGRWTNEYSLDLTDFTSISKVVITMAKRGQVQFNYVGYYDVTSGDNEFTTEINGFAGQVVPVKGTGTITKITVYGTKAGDSSSTPDDSSEIDSTGTIKYQLRQNDTTTDIRFILVADEQNVIAADSASFYATTADGENTASVKINRAYRSIIAGDQRITADEGTVFLIGKIARIPEEMIDEMIAHFTLGGNTYERVIDY